MSDTEITVPHAMYEGRECRIIKEQNGVCAIEFVDTSHGCDLSLVFKNRLEIIEGKTSIGVILDDGKTRSWKPYEKEQNG